MKMIYALYASSASRLKHLKMVGGALIAAGLLVACGSPDASATIQRTATLARGTLQASINASGNIQAEDEAKFAFQSGGLVAKVHVKVGDAVTKGSVLAELDTVDTGLALRRAQSSIKDAEAALIIAQANYSRTVEGARPAELAAAQVALRAANDAYAQTSAGPTDADIRAAKARLANAEAAVRRAQATYDQAFHQDPATITAHPAALALEQATNDYNLARAEYDKALQPAKQSDKSTALRQIAEAKSALDKLNQPARQYDIEKAKAEIAQAQNKIEQAKLDMETAQNKLNQSKLVAMLDGVVSAVDVKAGETVGTQPVVTLVDVSRLRIDINVDEVDVTKVKVGQSVSIRLDSLPGVALQGKVDRISPTSKIVNGVVSYPVKVGLPLDERRLKPGMTTNTQIVLEQRDNVVLVPTWALRKDKKTGKNFITVVDEADPEKKRTKELEVVLGLKDEAMAEVVSGAKEGTVVLQPSTVTAP